MYDRQKAILFGEYLKDNFTPADLISDPYWYPNGGGVEFYTTEQLFDKFEDKLNAEFTAHFLKYCNKGENI